MRRVQGTGHAGRRYPPGRVVRSLPAPAADAVRDDLGARARGRGRGIRFRVAHGPPGGARRRRPGHLRGLDARRGARGADHHDPDRASRHVRPVPASGGARQDGGDGRRPERRAPRAWAGLGITRRGADSLRARRGPGARAGGATRRVHRDRAAHVRRRVLRLRRRPLPPRAGHRASDPGAAARPDPPRRRRSDADDAARAPVRRLVELPVVRDGAARRAPPPRGRRAGVGAAPGRAGG